MWAGLLAILVMGCVSWLVYWSANSLGVPQAVAWLGGLLAAYFTSRAVLRGIWQHKSEQAPS